MTRVVVAGAFGRMGSLLSRMIAGSDRLDLVGGVDIRAGEQFGAPVVEPSGLAGLLEEVRPDVLVDFTVAPAAVQNIRTAAEHGVALVVGTTGFSSEQEAANRNAIEGRVPAVISTNFSIGVNVFWKACQTLARALPEYEVEIIEVHHDKKKDAPSGTAVKAAQLIAAENGVDRFVHGRNGMVGARGREIGIHAVRAGDVVGEHTVIFAGNRERIELTHRAHSRMAFAEGCIVAIRWIAPLRDGKVHGMDEVLGL